MRAWAGRELVALQGLDAPVDLASHFGLQPELVDVSAVYLALHEGTGAVEPFDHFHARAPKGWPATLEAAWDEAMATCRQALTRDRFSCAASIRGPLWQRFLESFAPAHVTTVVAVFGKVSSTLELRRYEVRSPKVLQLQTATSAGTVQADALKLLDRLVRGDGDAALRVVPGPVPPVPPKPDAVTLAQLGDGDGRVALPRCPRLPGALRFEVRTPLTIELERRWKASAPPSAATADCRLEETFDMGRAKDRTAKRVVLTVRCDAERARSSPLEVEPPPSAARVLPPLLEQLAREYCR